MKQDEPGFMERGALAVMNNLYTNLPPAELYQLGQAATHIDPSKLEGCVVQGSYGAINGASIVFPDTALAQRLGDEARDDATFDTAADPSPRVDATFRERSVNSAERDADQ